MSAETGLKLASENKKPAPEGLSMEDQLKKALAELAEVKALNQAKDLGRQYLPTQDELERQQVALCVVGLKEFFETVAPSQVLAFAKTWVAQAVWNSMGSFGLMKEKQLVTAQRRQQKADAVDLQGVSQQFGLEIPQVAARASEDRVATISEEIDFAAALRTACAGYYLAATGEEPRPFVRTGAANTAQPDPNLPAVGRPQRVSRFG